MLARNRKLTVVTAASYLLAITVSGLFHSHNDRGEDQPRPGVSASHHADGHDCPVCQFLAQKPAPAADVAPVGVGALSQQVTAPAPACALGDVFTAWQSRAPPVFA
jgi:hypothetical protein